ncbi:acyl-CoA thioesterase [Halovenus salina]|uniref:acyl-CoA thioesterase n=1 Tax=Halovenus salina TaxID=1510225 RepID=UPI002260836D|nr:thioesterase family protein [Halovenus salina]
MSDRYEMDIDVRFRDLDTMGQVHNAVVLIYVEEARVGYFRDVLGVELTETDGAIVKQTIEYSAPIERDSSVTIEYWTAEIGTSTLTMGFEVRTGGEPAATGEVVHVVLDGDTPHPVPDGWRERIRAFEDEPVETE